MSPRRVPPRPSLVAPPFPLPGWFNKKHQHTIFAFDTFIGGGCRAQRSAINNTKQSSASNPVTCARDVGWSARRCCAETAPCGSAAAVVVCGGMRGSKPPGRYDRCFVRSVATRRHLPVRARGQIASVVTGGGRRPMGRVVRRRGASAVPVGGGRAPRYHPSPRNAGSLRRSVHHRRRCAASEAAMRVGARSRREARERKPTKSQRTLGGGCLYVWETRASGPSLGSGV